VGMDIAARHTQPCSRQPTTGNLALGNRQPIGLIPSLPPLAPIFAPYRDIARQIADRLAASRAGVDPLAPWEHEVIVPSRGAAEQIARALLARLPRGLAGLQLGTLEELARSLTSGIRVASDAERRLAMRLAVRTVEHPMMQSRGIAAMLERAYRDVRDAGISLAELTRRVSTARGLRNPARTAAILRVWAEYERIIQQLGATDPSELLLRAARQVDTKVRPQFLAGFYDVTGAQWALIAALRAAGRLEDVWIPTTEAFAIPFASRFEADVESRAHSPREARVLRYETPMHELRGVCDRVATQLAQGVDPGEIGIVARSFEPWDARLLQRFASDSGFRTTLDESIPLSSHRLGRGALALLRLRERDFPRNDVLELVRDGLRTKLRVDVDALDVATRRARIAGGTSAQLGPLRQRNPLLEEYAQLVTELEELQGESLTDFGSLFRVESDLDLEAAAQLDAIATLFRRIGRPALSFDVIDAIEHASLTRRADVDPSRPVIWAGDVMRYRGRTFEHLHVVRMQDDVFPQRRTEDPLFPDSDRRLLGMREIGDGRTEEQLLFSLLEAESWSFATGDGFGKVLRPSRLLRAIPHDRIESGPRSAPVIHGVAPQRTLQLLAKAGSSSSFDGSLTSFTSPLDSFSPTQLEDFGECPQKFLLKHILKVEDLEDPERELQIDHREKGIVVHRILERFYRETDEEQVRAAAAALPTLPPAIIERLERLIDEQFDEHERQFPPFNRTIRDIERRATKRILREFIAADLEDLAAQDLIPRWFEYRFGRKHRVPADHPEPFIIETGGLPVRVEGTVDRIDEGGGRYRIVDYKGGKALRHAGLGTKIDRGVRLQLALYAMSVASFFDTRTDQVSGVIKPLVPGEKLDKFAFALEEKQERLLETLRIFLDAIAAGHFPAYPNEDDREFNSCKYCPVNHSCRTKHDAEERAAVLRFEDPRTLLQERESS
jgi:hypothetical protein